MRFVSWKGKEQPNWEPTDTHSRASRFPGRAATLGHGQGEARQDKEPLLTFRDDGRAPMKQLLLPGPKPPCPAGSRPRNTEWPVLVVLYQTGWAQGAGPGPQEGQAHQEGPCVSTSRTLSELWLWAQDALTMVSSKLAPPPPPTGLPVRCQAEGPCHGLGGPLFQEGGACFPPDLGHLPEGEVGGRCGLPPPPACIRSGV